MTAWFRTRGRAEHFEARLDGSLPGSHRAADEEIESLVALARTLRTHGSADASATPREAFASELRERLMAEAPSVLTAEATEDAAIPVPVRKPGSRERRLVAAATAAVVLGGGVGIATASQNSLPGDTLYPVKRIVERADVVLSGSPGARGHDLLHQATGRLGEARDLLAEDDGTSAALVPGTLHAFTTQGREGAKLLLGDYQQNQRPASVLAVRQFAVASLKTLNDLSATAPPGAQPVIRDAEEMLAEIDESASTLCASCADLPDLRLSPTFVVSGEVTRARAQVNGAKLEHSRPVVVEVPAPKAPEAATVGAGAAPARKPAQAPARASAQAPGQRPGQGPGQTSGSEARPEPVLAPAPEVVLSRPPAARPADPSASSKRRSRVPVAPSATILPKVSTPKAPTLTKAPAAADNPLPAPLESVVVSPDLPAVKHKVEVLPAQPQPRAGLPKTVLPEIKGSVGNPGQ